MMLVTRHYQLTSYDNGHVICRAICHVICHVIVSLITNG